MGVLQEIILMIDHIVVISWDIHILKQLLSTGIQTSLLFFVHPIMHGLMNIIIVSPQNTITLPVIYSFNNILKVFFMIRTRSTLFHIKLIIYPLHFMITKQLHMKFIYLLLERKLVLIYWMMNILKSLMSLIQSQIHQPIINFLHGLRKMCGSFLPMKKSPSQLKALLMKFGAIRLEV